MPCLHTCPSHASSSGSRFRLRCRCRWYAKLGENSDAAAGPATRQHFQQHRRSPVSRHSACRDELGQAIPLVIGVVAVMALLLIGVAWLSTSVIDAASARTAADAAALAGAVDGRSAASRLAADNGAELVAFQHIGDDVVVTVRVGRATVSARATANRARLSRLDFRDADQQAG
jgi:hypothetical protein